MCLMTSSTVTAKELFSIVEIVVAQHKGLQVTMVPAFAIAYQGKVMITDKSEQPMWSHDRAEVEASLRGLIGENE